MLPLLETLATSLREVISRLGFMPEPAAHTLVRENHSDPPTPSTDNQALAGFEADFKRLIHDNNMGELRLLRNLMYATNSTARSFNIHFMLGKYFLDEQNYHDALQEFNYAVRDAPADISARMRRCLTLISLKHYDVALDGVNEMTDRFKHMRFAAEVCGLIGRAHRELWEQSNETDLHELSAAIKAYHTGMQAEPNDYYTAINWAELSAAHDAHQGLEQEQIRTAAIPRFQIVRQRCLAAQSQNHDDSFWLYATLGEVELGLGRAVEGDPIERAKAQYTLSLGRNPRPRMWTSAMDGVRRIARYLGYSDGAVNAINAIAPTSRS